MNMLALLAFSPFDPMHMLVIGVVALLLFGKRLPEVGRSLGRGISEFKKGLKDVQEELSKEEPHVPPPKLHPPSETHARSEQRVPAEHEAR